MDTVKKAKENTDTTKAPAVENNALPPVTIRPEDWKLEEAIKESGNQSDRNAQELER